MVCENPLKRCNRVFMIKFFISSDHYFSSSFLLGTVSSKGRALFNFYSGLQNLQWKAETTQYDTRHQKNIWFALSEITCQVTNDFTGTHYSLDLRGFKKRLYNKYCFVVHMESDKHCFIIQVLSKKGVDQHLHSRERISHQLKNLFHSLSCGRVVSHWTARNSCTSRILAPT